MKANPPQLHSNLKFIQLFRRQSKLVSEIEFYLTSMISTELFIINIDARSLSMEETEFQKSMESAKLAIDGPSIEPIAEVETYKDIISTMHCDKEIILDGKFQCPSVSTGFQFFTLIHYLCFAHGTLFHFLIALKLVKLALIPDVLNWFRGQISIYGVEARHLTLSEVQDLLCLYKQPVKRYTMLSNTPSA